MLPDIERKVLRILHNFTAKYRRGPSFDELRTMTGRSRQDLEAAIRSLQIQSYVSWDGRDPSTVMILKAWE
ncbi:MAG: hypothetical protein K6T85_12810 [Gorillibacterium sp.]|nr:hypothetical protein [Gorillibacterium sp.]